MDMLIARNGQSRTVLWSVCSANCRQGQKGKSGRSLQPYFPRRVEIKGKKSV